MAFQGYWKRGPVWFELGARPGLRLSSFVFAIPGTGDAQGGFGRPLTDPLIHVL